MRTPPVEDTDTSRAVLGHSAVMAAGTVVSRASGFVRTGLLAAALGSQLHAEVFNVANTIPNMLYILLAGGLFNAVLVPQLVRAMTADPDGGEAYTNRVITAAALFLAASTVVLVVAAPWLMQLFGINGFASDAARQSAIDFARFCLPQVFFYGMFVLVGQVLNARRSFGPMMWAPIANNVISVLVLVVYLVVFGPAQGAERFGGYTGGQELLLGVGSTLGIAAQFVILVPYLRAAGFTYRPRFDFRGTGLSHTLRLGIWTVLFVIVNQVAYVVVVRLAVSGTESGSAEGTGYSIYSGAFLFVMVPHSVITVSLATAVLPYLSRLAADGDLLGLGRSLGSSLRTALAMVVPFAGLLPLIALPLAKVLFGSFGAAAETYDNYAPSLALFGPGIVLFTVHYLMLRGFYSLEQTRTVFFIQCAVSATNIVVAVLLVGATSEHHTSPALIGAYTAAYLVGAATSYAMLRGRLGDLGNDVMPGYLLRLALAVAGATVTGYAVHLELPGGDGDPGLLPALVHLVVIAAVDGIVYLALARLLLIDEVSSVVATVTRRLPSAGRR